MDITDDAGIRTLTLDRPDVKNALTPEIAVDIAEAIEDAEADIHDAIVLTGAGDAFCSGGDIVAMAERDWPADERSHIVESTFGYLAEAMLAADVPIVARVNGDAVGAGLSLVLLSDFAYAVEDARFNAGFARVGLIPDSGGTFLLPQIVGLRAAKRLVLAAEFVGADEAAELGLVSEAVSAAELDAAVEDCLNRLQLLPTETLGRVRRAMHENLGRPYRDGLSNEALWQAEAYATEAHREGVAAFLDRHGADE